MLGSSRRAGYGHTVSVRADHVTTQWKQRRCQPGRIGVSIYDGRSSGTFPKCALRSRVQPRPLSTGAVSEDPDCNIEVVVVMHRCKGVASTPGRPSRKSIGASEERQRERDFRRASALDGSRTPRPVGLTNFRNPASSADAVVDGPCGWSSSLTFPRGGVASVGLPGGPRARLVLRGESTLPR
jgi:hypothetical protein